MLRFSIPAPALTFNHQIMLSFYQRQLQYFVAFRAAFFTEQEFQTRKEVYSDASFFNLLITFSETICIDSSSSPLQQNVEVDGVWTRREEM